MGIKLWIILVVNQGLSLASLYALIGYERSLLMPLICVTWFVALLGFDKLHPVSGKLCNIVFILIIVEVLLLFLLLVFSHFKYEEIKYEPYYVSLILINGFLLKYSKLGKT